MSRYPRTALEVPSTVSLAEAKTNLLALDEELQVIPASGRSSLLAAIDVLIEQGAIYEEKGLESAVHNATRLIGAVSGVPQARHNLFLPSAEAEPLHRTRNLLLSLVLAGVIEYNGDPSNIVRAFPTPRSRTNMSLRANTDDEVLLMRLWVLHLSKGDANNRRAAAVYAQMDAGLVAGETTKTTWSDLALTPGPAMITAHGHDGGVRKRDLALDAFAVRILTAYATGICTSTSPTDLLTYRPRKATGYGAACASAVGIIDRIRAAVGLKHLDTTASSVWMWRAEETKATQGMKAAVELTGRTDMNNLHGLLRNSSRAKHNPTKTRRTLTMV